MIVKTNEMIQISKDIKDLAVEYQTLISKMYTGFSNLSSDGRWTGERATQYISYVMQDKDKYIAIGDTIKNFANAIQDHANYIQSSVSKILEDERNG